MLVKLVPVAVSKKELDPAVAAEGEMLVSVGVGLLAFAVIVKVRLLELPPPGLGLFTKILADPAVSTSDALIVAVN